YAAQQIVCNNLAGSDSEILQHAPPELSDGERRAFVDAIQYDLDYLYDGNVARFRLRFSEYERWRFKRYRV
ncbi:MAG: hypothetical protein RL748_338, partial [Pseudomonadota bacterium]